MNGFKVLLIILLFLGVFKIEASEVNSPNNLRFEIDSNSVLLRWDWSFEPGDTIGFPPTDSSLSSFSYTNCPYCGSEATLEATFEVQVSYDNVTYSTVAKGVQEKNYRLTFLSNKPYKFRVRALRFYSLTDSYSYSSYSYAKVMKLHKPEITPSNNHILKTKKIKIEVSEDAQTKVKVIPFGEECTDSNWNNYFLSFSINTNKRICSKKVKDGLFPSDIAFKDYQVVEKSVVFIHTDLLGSPIAETN